MKHLRHINESFDFDSLIKDPTVNNILNIARDEGYDVQFNAGLRLIFIYFNDRITEHEFEDIEKFKECAIDVYRRLLHNDIDIKSVSGRYINKYRSYTSGPPLTDINDFNTKEKDKEKDKYRTSLVGIRFKLS